MHRDIGEKARKRSGRRCWKCRVLRKQKLKRNWAPRRPGVFVVFCVGKGEVEEVSAGAIPFPDKTVPHASGRLVVVARPAAVAVDLEVPSWLRRHPLDQVV